jgi:DNA-binding NarL/FixJ family response regulator
VNACDWVLLSPRETEVLALIAAGHPNKEIAHRLHLTENTVKTHVSRLMMQLRLGNRVCLAIWALVHPAALRHEAVDPTHFPYQEKAA